jgi:hypothetical protein
MISGAKTGERKVVGVYAPINAFVSLSNLGITASRFSPFAFAGLLQGNTMQK